MESRHVLGWRRSPDPRGALRWVGRVSTTSITQQQAAPGAPARHPRTNPWQRGLALLALVPAVLGAGVVVALTQNHAGDGSAVVELSVALRAFGVAFSFALLWLVVAPSTGRSRKRSGAAPDR